MKSCSLLVLVAILIGCRRGEEVRPTRQDITESVYASGVVKSRKQYSVYSTVNGLVREIMVHEGESVRQGQPLMRILNDPSALNAENSKLAADYFDFSANSGKLKELQASIDLLKTKMMNDSLLAVRQRSLWSQGIGTKVTLEQSELAYMNSLTSYQQAMLNLEDLKRNLEFQSRQSKTNLKISTALAHDYVIHSMIDGKVYKLYPEIGEFANTLRPVAIVGEVNNFFVELKVDEFDIGRLLVNQRVILTLDSYKDKVFEARVEDIEPLMNEETRSFSVNAAFVTRPDALYPGLSVQANIIIRTEENALTIPRNYLVGDTVVFLRGGDKRRVTAGVKDYQRAEIRKGLTQGDVLQRPPL